MGLAARDDGLGPAAAGAAVLGVLAAGAYGPALAGCAERSPDWSLIGDQGAALKLHFGAAVGSLLVGAALLGGVTGRGWHKRLGWTYVVLMLATAASSFWLRELRPGGLSWIHALSGWVLVAAPGALYAARRRRIPLHRKMMLGLFVGGTIGAGVFACMPGRLLWRVVFG